MHLVAAPTKEIAQQYATNARLESTMWSFLEAPWQVIGREPDFVEMHVVNGGPKKGPARQALDAWSDVSDPNTWKHGSVREGHTGKSLTKAQAKALKFMLRHKAFATTSSLCIGRGTDPVERTVARLAGESLDEMGLACIYQHNGARSVYLTEEGRTVAGKL